MRRFILGWKTLGYAQRFRSVIVNDADDCVVLGKAVDGIRDSGYADGGHVDDDTTQTDDERSQDPVRALSRPIFNKIFDKFVKFHCFCDLSEYFFL